MRIFFSSIGLFILFVYTASVASKTALAKSIDIDEKKNKTHTEAITCDASKNKHSLFDQTKLLNAIKNRLHGLMDPDWTQFPEISEYSASKNVQDMINYAMAHKYPRSHRKCYKYVKNAMLKGGKLIDEYPPLKHARQAADDLKKRGFINIMEDPRYKDIIKKPSDAPKGAILVYRHRTNIKHSGHIEVKTDSGHNGGYVSDFFHDNPNGIDDRILIGVMVKI